MLARIFILIGGLFVLALTVALVGPYFIDWTNYRADFEREASTILGRKVVVRGDASARLLPFPSVTFTDVLVGDEGSAPAMTVETFSMDAELAPFMSGEFRIFDMRLVRPKVSVTVDAGGRIDWAMRPAAPFAAKQTSLEKLTITEGQVVIHHAASGRDHLLTEVNLDASARSLVGPWRIDGSLRADGREAAVAISTGAVADDGAVRLKIRANPEIYPITIETDGDVRLADGAATYGGTFKVAAKDDAAAELSGKGAAGKSDRDLVPANRLSGTFTVDSARLSVDAFRFETGPLDDPYIADGKASVELGPEARFAIVADGAQVRLGDDADAGGPVAGQTLAQRLSAFQEMLADLPKPTIPGTIEVNLPAIVAGDTMVRDVRMSAAPADAGWSVKSLSAVLPGRATVEAKGFLGTEGVLGFKGSLLLAVAQPSGFMAWLSKDVDEAIRRLPRAGFSADVHLTPTEQTFDNLELQLGAARFRGQMVAKEPANVRPSMQVRLDGGALDVDGLAAFASLFVSDKGDSHFGDTDLDFAVKAGPVVAAGMTADTLDTAIRLREGVAEIDRLTIAGLAGATISATGRVKDFPARPIGSIDASIVAVDLQPLVDLFAERFPSQPLAKALRDRGAAFTGLFADSEIDLVAEATPERDSIAYALKASGTTGGTEFTADYRGPLGDPDAPVKVDLSAKNGDATALMALAGMHALPLGLTGAGEAVLSADGSWSTGLAAKARFTGEGATASFDGTILRADGKLAVKGKAALQADDIEPWMMTAGVGLPGMGLGTGVDLTADADYGSGLLVLSNLTGAVAEGAVAGDINLEVKDGIPDLSGQMTLDEFDLYPFARMILGDDTLESAGSGWATQPFQQKSLAPLTLDLDLTAGSLSAGPIATASDAHAIVRLDAEGLRVTDLTGKMAGGSVGGLFDLKNNAGTGLLSAQLKLGDADVSQLIDGLTIAGRGDFSCALSASGKTIESIVASLSGSGTASLRDLDIPGIDPNAFPALIAGADRIGRDIDAARTAGFAPALVGGGSYPAGATDVAFTIAAGVLRTPPIVFDNPAARLSADVRADANDGTVSATGTIGYAAGDEALVGSQPDVGFEVSGVPGALAVKFDTDPLAQFLTQRALEAEQARVEAMQADLLEKQRLRREVRYYASLEDDRRRLALERQLAEQDALRKAQDAADVKAKEDALDKADAEAKARDDAEAEAFRATVEAARAAKAAERRKTQDAPKNAAKPSGDLPGVDTDAFDTGKPAPKKKLNFLGIFGAGQTQ